MNYIFWGIWAVCIIIMIVYYTKRERPILSAIFSMLCGGGALVICHFYGDIINFTPPINLFNTMLSLTLGLPSIILLYISSLI